MNRKIVLASNNKKKMKEMQDSFMIAGILSC